MEAYKSPESEIEESAAYHRPVRGLIKSLFLSTIGLMIATILFMVVFAMAIGEDLNQEGSPDSFMYTNLTYMWSSLIVALVILYFSGKVLANNLYMNFNEWGLGLVVISLMVYLAPYLIWDIENHSPTWYLVASWVSIPLAIMLGVKIREKNITKGSY